MVTKQRHVGAVVRMESITITLMSYLFYYEVYIRD